MAATSYSTARFLFAVKPAKQFHCAPNPEVQELTSKPDRQYDSPHITLTQWSKREPIPSFNSLPYALNNFLTIDALKAGTKYI